MTKIVVCEQQQISEIKSASHFFRFFFCGNFCLFRKNRTSAGVLRLACWGLNRFNLLFKQFMEEGFIGDLVEDHLLVKSQITGVFTFGFLTFLHYLVFCFFFCYI